MNCVCVHPPNSHSPHENRTPQSQTINHLRVERKKSLADLIQNNLSLKLENFSGEKELSSRAYKSSAENEKKNWIYARRRMLESHLSTPLVWQWRKKGSRARNSQNEFRVFFTSWIHKTPGSSSSCHCCKFLKWEKDVKVLWTRKNHQLPLIPMWIIKIFPEQLQFPVNHNIVFPVSLSFPLLISVNENLWIISHCKKFRQILF